MVKFNRETLGLWTVKADRFLSTPRNIVPAVGVMLLLLTLFFVYRGAESARNLQPTLDEIHQTAADVRLILCKDGEGKPIATEDCNLSQAVVQLTQDNERQTFVLCRLILRDTRLGDLEPKDERLVEQICQEEIDKIRQSAAQTGSGRLGFVDSASTAPAAPQGAQNGGTQQNPDNGQGMPPGSPSNPTPPKPTPPPPPEQPPEPEPEEPQPGLVQRVIDDILGLVRGITGALAD